MQMRQGSPHANRHRAEHTGPILAAHTRLPSPESASRAPAPPQSPNWSRPNRLTTHRIISRPWHTPSFPALPRTQRCKDCIALCSALKCIQRRRAVVARARVDGRARHDGSRNPNDSLTSAVHISPCVMMSHFTCQEDGDVTAIHVYQTLCRAGRPNPNPPINPADQPSRRRQRMRPSHSPSHLPTYTRSCVHHGADRRVVQ
jgi:hypothetical protein